MWSIACCLCCQEPELCGKAALIFWTIPNDATIKTDKIICLFIMYPSKHTLLKSLIILFLVLLLILYLSIDFKKMARSNNFAYDKSKNNYCFSIIKYWHSIKQLPKLYRTCKCIKEKYIIEKHIVKEKYEINKKFCFSSIYTHLPGFRSWRQSVTHIFKRQSNVLSGNHSRLSPWAPVWFIAMQHGHFATWCEQNASNIRLRLEKN